jgi:hypothetical protein
MGKGEDMLKISIKTNIYIKFSQRALLFAVLLLPLAASAAAIVTDLTGKASVQAGGKSGPLAILAEIEANARVQLEAGARMVALYTRSGDEFVLNGPALIHFRPDAPAALSGAAPQKRSSAIGRDAGIRIRPAAATQAAYVMRSARSTARIRLLSLSGTRTLETSPEFRWQDSESGKTYRFELTDETGKSLYETEVAGTVLKLPAAMRLQAGAGYTWEVSARAADGRRYVSAGDFSVAPAELRERATALRPAADAPVSDRVAYAAWLAQMELRDDARRYWQALAKERPDDAGLKVLAAN